VGALGEVKAAKSTDSGLDVEFDQSGGHIRTADHFDGAGTDAVPLPGDTVAQQPCSGTGSVLAVGYCDPIAANRKATAGERRIYSRNPLTGVAVAEVYCKADGTIVIASLNGSPIELTSTGRVTVNAPDVRLGAGGRQVACVGDFVGGSIRGVTLVAGAPVPLLPLPPATPSPTGGVTFVGQIISGVSGVSAGTGTGT